MIGTGSVAKAPKKPQIGRYLRYRYRYR